MGDVFTPIDVILFFTALIGVMAVGLYAGRKEDTSEDYFLAGRNIPWWGVAGSIYGSNVSANHMVGMLGVGFSIGFYQSHFELGAILGLMVLCYGFLPVYRKIGAFTLSEYLGKRYDDRSRAAYAIIMVVIMAVVQMVPALYIGSRTICLLLGDDAVEQVEGDPESQVTLAELKTAGSVEAAAAGKAVKSRVNVKFGYYTLFVLAFAAVSAGYTIVGGLKAVVWTDFLQSMLLLAAGLLIAFLTFQQVGGWGAMMTADRAVDAVDGSGKMHLYLPTDHPELPWTGVFTGLMAMHCFYWGTNQFIVQRALGARSDSDARLGIIAAGFLKLLIPFFAIGTGVAAFYLFQDALPNQTVSPDAAFSELVKLVIPIGYGIIGVIAAGLIGAILSSIDSMMNSAATIVTIDFYQKYVKPDATDAEMIRIGRWSIVGFVIAASLMALFIMDPNSDENFFLQIANYQNYLTPGLLVAFFLGMFWRRGTPTAAFVTIVAGVVFSWVVVEIYDSQFGMPRAFYDVATESKAIDDLRIGDLPRSYRESDYGVIEDAIETAGTQLNPVNRFLGPQLNFFHRVVAVLLLSGVVFVLVSKLTTTDEAKSRLTWSELGGHSAAASFGLLRLILISIGFFILVGIGMARAGLSPSIAAWVAGLWTFGVFQFHISRNRRRTGTGVSDAVAGELVPLPRDDRFWASFLCSAAVFMHYYYF